MRTALLLVTLLTTTAAFAQKNPDLEKAQKLLAGKKYADALKALEAAEKKGGLDNESLMTLLESKGLAEASLKKMDAAEQSFKKLLVLDARRDMTGKYKGDVVKAIDAALAWVKANGALEVAALEPVSKGGKVTQVGLSIKSDPLKWATSARIYVKDGSSWKPVDVAITNGTAAADTDAASVEFWAEVQDSAKNQLVFLGSAIRPVKQSAPAAAPVAVKAKPEPVKSEPVAAAPVKEAEPKLTPTDANPNESLTDDGKKGGSALRPASYGVIAAAVISAGIGMGLGVASNSARSQILADQMAGGFAQQELYDRDQSRLGLARGANSLFVVAGVLLVVGIVMFVVGG